MNKTIEMIDNLKNAIGKLSEIADAMPDCGCKLLVRVQEVIIMRALNDLIAEIGRSAKEDNERLGDITRRMKCLSELES